MSTPASHSVSAPSGIASPLDDRWFAEKVQPHEPALRAYLKGRFPTLSDIDDLIQETYARLFRARGAGRAIVDVRPYLFATGRNAAVDLFRRRQCVMINNVAEIDRLEAFAEATDVAEAINREQEIELLHEAIESLPDRCRQVLALRRFDGHSVREIAQMLGITESTVDAHLCLGVFRCRRYLLCLLYTSDAADE